MGMARMMREMVASGSFGIAGPFLMLLCGLSVLGALYFVARGVASFAVSFPCVLCVDFACGLPCCFGSVLG